MVRSSDGTWSHNGTTPSTKSPNSTMPSSADTALANGTATNQPTIGSRTTLVTDKPGNPFDANYTGIVPANNMPRTSSPSSNIILASGDSNFNAAFPLEGVNLFGQTVKFDDKNGMHYPKDPGLPEQMSFNSLIDSNDSFYNKRAGYFPAEKPMDADVSPQDLAAYSNGMLVETSIGRRLVEGAGPGISEGMDTHLTTGTMDRVLAHPNDAKRGIYFQDAHVHRDGTGPSDADRLALAQQHVENQQVVPNVRVPIPVAMTRDNNGNWISIEYGPWHNVGDVPTAVSWPGLVAQGYGLPVVNFRTLANKLPSGGYSTQGVVRISGLSETVDVGRLNTYLKSLAAEHNLDAITVELDIGTSKRAADKISAHSTEMYPFSHALKYDFITGNDVYSVRQYDASGKVLDPDPSTRLLTWQVKLNNVTPKVTPDPYGITTAHESMLDLALGETIPLASNFKIISPKDQARAQELQETHLEGTQRLPDDQTYWAGLDGDTVRVIQKPAAVAGESKVSLSETTIAMLRQAQEDNVRLRDLELILPDGLAGITTSSLNTAELSGAFALTDTGKTFLSHGFKVRHVLPMPGVDTGNNLLVQLRIPSEIPSGISQATATASPTLQSPNGWSWPADNTIERKNVLKTIAGEQAQAHIATLPVDAPLTMVNGLGSTLGRYLSDNPEIQQLSLYVPQNSALGRHLQGAFTNGSDVKQILGQRFGNEAARLVSLDHQLQPLYSAGWDATAAKRVSDSQGNPGYSFQFRRAPATTTNSEGMPTSAKQVPAAKDKVQKYSF